MMQAGVNWDVERARAKAEQLDNRRQELLAGLRERGLGHLCSTERHRSRVYAHLLEEQRGLKSLPKPLTAEAKQRIKELAAESRIIRENGLQTEEIVKGISDEKIKNYLYKQEKVPTIRQRRKGKGESTPTVNDTALLSIKQNYPRFAPLVDLILEYRRCQKLVSTYLDPGKVSPDGRIRFSYKPHGTQSGRLASAGAILGGGFNIQNPDNELKFLIIPDPGE